MNVRTKIIITSCMLFSIMVLSIAVPGELQSKSSSEPIVLTDTTRKAEVAPFVGYYLDEECRLAPGGQKGALDNVPFAVNKKKNLDFGLTEACGWVRFTVRDESDSKRWILEFDETAAEGETKVLIVDDDPVNIQVLSNQLSMMNVSVTTALNGTDALAMIDRGVSFDLILLDIMMPRITGYEVCRTIREKYSANELPIIMLTAKNLVSDLVMGFDSGANDYIVKPFEKRVLMSRVKTAIRLKQAFHEHKELAKMEKELVIAEMVQRQILTAENSYSRIKMAEIDVQYRPMNGKVGGDYYNVTRLSDDFVSIMLADATGHGIQAALSTMQIDILHKQSFVISGPHKRMQYINEYMLKEMVNRNYFTAFMMDLYRDRIVYANAGHPGQILFRKSTEELILLEGRGGIIGLDPDMKYEEREISLGPGDIVFLYSDGLFEEFDRNNEEYGEERLMGQLEAFMIGGMADRPLREINEAVITKVKEFVGDAPLNDDITLIAVRLK